jgi:hypothetical protein
MKKISKILLSSLFLVLVGCSTTPNEMRADANEKGSVTVDMPFDIVRANGGMRVSYGELDIKDVKLGEFTTLNVLQKGATSMVRVSHSFDIRKNSAGNTEVSWFVAGLITKNFKPTIEYWVKGLEGRCGMVYDK